MNATTMSSTTTAQTQHNIARWIGAGMLSLGLLAGSLGLGAGAAHADAIMQVRVTDSADPVGVGEQLTYTMTVKNAGDEGSANVTLTASISNGTFQANSADQPGVNRFQQGCTLTAQQLRCSGGFFDRNEEGRVTVRVTAPAQAGEMRLRATVSRGTNATTDGTGFQDTAVIVRPDLVVTDIDGPSAVGDGASGSYVITVRNRGGSTATGVLLVVRSESLPWDFFQVDVLDDASNFTCGLALTLSFQTPTVNCTGGSLSAGETARVRIRARTSNVIGTGNGRIRATIDPSNTIKESNEDNNSRNHAVSFNGGIL
jgi:uncharacterized repeat protein (TIGR01451 family)